jgi:hypothetical protein
MIAHIALHALLGVLATYHLGIGVVSLFSPAATARIARTMYGIAVSENPQLRYAMRMLGLYALALGTLLALAAVNPRANRNVILVVCGLLLARAACRIVLRRELGAAFQVPPRRNGLNAALLVVEAVVLALLLGTVPR